MNNQRRAFVVVLFFNLLLSGCGAGQVFGPTVTPTPTITYTPTLTPTPSATFTPTLTFTPTATSTPTATFTPTDTPTREIKQFKKCTPENFHDCPIDVEDLFNGDYYYWLNTLSTPFDSSKIKDVPLVYSYPRSEWIWYEPTTTPNFKEKGTAPFRRDVTAAFTSMPMLDGKILNFAVLPIEYFDKYEPSKNKWVITVSSMYYQKGNINAENRNIRIWRRELGIPLILTDAKIRTTDIYNPILLKTFGTFSPMKERFDKFVAGDVSALSAPGLVIGTEIVWFPENPNIAK